MKTTAVNQCQMCKERKWEHQGDAPKCSFPNGVVDSAGWNCATANAIRDICDQDEDPIKGIATQYCDDQWYATIKIDDVGIGAYALWVSWYKHRGRTEEMYLMGGSTPRIPTEAECRAIIKHYEANEK